MLDAAMKYIIHHFRITELRSCDVSFEINEPVMTNTDMKTTSMEDGEGKVGTRHAITEPPSDQLDTTRRR